MKTMRQVMIDTVLDRMMELDGNRTHVANSLGISRKTLLNWLSGWELNLPDRKVYLAERLIRERQEKKQRVILPVGEIKNPCRSRGNTREPQEKT